MNKYESVIIIKPILSSKEQKELIKDVEKNIKKIAKITNKKEFGIRKLAYQIQKYNEGIYISYEFELKRKDRDMTEEIRKIENYFKTRIEIIKFIVINIY